MLRGFSNLIVAEAKKKRVKRDLWISGYLDSGTDRSWFSIPVPIKGIRDAWRNGYF